MRTFFFWRRRVRSAAGIVCVKGPRKGKDYRVMDGKNFVGRADDMDIQILGDNKIARRNHAVIVFDAKKRENMILPGDSNGLVYLNGEAVYLPQPLSAYDVIEMGESTFLFVPFCGEHYMWGGRVNECPVPDSLYLMRFLRNCIFVPFLSGIPERQRGI